MNLRGGGAMFVASHATHWRFHPTEPDLVDVAVAAFNLTPDAHLHCVETTIFLTDTHIKEGKIGPGDEVVIVGLFTKLEGQSKNIPLVRVGNLAMLPDKGELLPVKIGDSFRNLEIYLIEARSIGGLSGSPVFVRETLEFSANVKDAHGTPVNRLFHVPGAFYLLGLACRHWEIDKQNRNQVIFPSTNPRTNPDAVNLGIAIIVPAKKIHEVIDHPDFVDQRQRFISELTRLRTAEESEVQSDSSES